MKAGVEKAFDIPGFVPEYIRPLFCQGKGPFRWAALSGEAEDIYVTDQAVIEEFPEDKALGRWIKKAQEQVAFQGLPSRICWLGYGERARFGERINHLVKTGKISAPVVIGRDHLDTGSVASPYRETEGMKDGGRLIINSSKTAEELRGEFDLKDYPLALVDANTIAREELGIPITNTTMVGALVRATGAVELESLVGPFTDRKSVGRERV